MQQTADAVAETKDLMDVDVDLETILVSGSSYFFYSVAATAGAEIVVDADATIAVSGLSSCCSAVADLEATEAETAADVAATTVATNP